MKSGKPHTNYAWSKRTLPYLPEDYENDARKETVEVFVSRFRSSLCQGCGQPKAPNRRCYDCWINGRTERGKKVVSAAKQLQLAEARKKLKAERQKRFEANKKKGKIRAQIKAEKDKIKKKNCRKKGTYAHLRRERTLAGRWMITIIERLLNCFEYDELGQLQVYLDTIEDVVKPTMEEVALMLPRIKETYAPHKSSKKDGGDES